MSSQRRLINSWMKIDRLTGWRLWVQFIEKREKPVVLFEAFANPGPGMKAAPRGSNTAVWFTLVAGANKQNPLVFSVRYRYERIDQS